MKFCQLSILEIVLLALVHGAIFGAEIRLPDLQNAPKPQPEPVAPAGWDTFKPPVDLSVPSADAPTVAEWTRLGGPDDTLILTGDQLSRFAGVEEGKDTQFLIYGQTTPDNGMLAAGLIERLDGLKSAVTLPATLPPWSTYFLWPINSAGSGYPVGINRTDAWWLNRDDKVSRGDTVSIFGRNLAHGGGTISSWIYIKQAGVTAVGKWATVTSVNPYRVQFTIPDTLTNGAYEVWIHNGHGGSYGWSGPLSVTIADQYNWNGTVFNVKDYGAKSDGVSDDTGAILNAYSAALAYRDRSGSPVTLHPTLYFPSGVYLLHQGISLQHDMRFTGDGKNLTILRCSATFQHTSDQGLIYGEPDPEHDIEVSNLTLDANGCFSETTFPYDYLLNFTFVRNWQDIRFSNLGVQVSNAGNRVNAASFGSVNRLALSDCDITGGNIMLMNSTHIAIDRCSFPFVNDVFTAIYCQSVNGVSVTNCHCADLDGNSDTGQGLGRLAILGGYLGSQRNFYLADNQTVKCGPRIGVHDQNTGEQILSEGNVVRYEGTPVASTGNTTTFSDLTVDPNLRATQTALIVKGKGLGQIRQITGINYPGKTITVSPDWNVAPDSTSVVQVAWTTDRCVIYDNTLNGKDDYGTRLTNTCGILAYGGCNEWIADGNNITSMRNGIYIAGLAQYSADPVTTNEPCFFHYYANNIIQRCFRGLFYFAEIPSNAQGAALLSGVHLALLGNTFRDNQWSDFTSGGLCFDGSTSGMPVDMTLFEHNTFINLTQGINFRSEGHESEAVNTLLYKNTFDRGIAHFSGSFGANFIASTVSPALRANMWTGFETGFSGSLPDPLLEIPVRVLTAQAPDGAAVTSQASIQNSGTVPLNWTASSNSPWLKLSATSGTVSDERSFTSLLINSDPSGLQVGTFLGTVSITAGAQTKKITVILSVGSAITPPKTAKITTFITLPPTSL